MFLITTADEQFWKKDVSVLCLGEWCKLYSKKALWQNIPHEVLDYHWDDRSRLFADYQYLQGLYERVLVDLTRCLNEIHGTDYPLRYWRMMIGPWLFFFIQVFYDRYRCIENAAKSGKVTDSLIGTYAPNAWIPKDYSHFSKWIAGDQFNQFLYSWIIEHGKFFSYRSKQVDAVSDPVDTKQKPWFKQLGKKLILAYEKLLPHRLNRYVFISSYLQPKDQWLLQLSLAQWPSLFAPQVKVEEGSVDLEMRNQLCLSTAGSSFEKLLAQIIPQQIPKVYVEDYAPLKKQALDQYPQQAKVILTANDLYSNEAFKCWAAQMVQQGVGLVGVQHGGLYGAALFNSSEEHEIEVSDTFYTWGWKSDVGDKTVPLASAPLNRFKKGVAPDSQGKALLTLGLMPRYSYHLYSVYVSSTGALAYFNDQFSFIKGLSEDVRKDLSIRLFPQDFGWSQKERFQEVFPEAVFDTHATMLEAMTSSRLCIATYNSTTYLESFVANFPTIMFWNPNHWETRASVREYFDELRRVGILHDTPQSAAKKVNEIFSDPMAWWQKAEVQNAKNKFCDRFAKDSDHWFQEWRKELRLERKCA